MATPTDPSRQDVVRKQNRGPQFKFLVPLIYAPVLPLIRLTLRHRPVLRDRLFTGVLVGAFAHGLFLVKGLTFNFNWFKRIVMHIQAGATTSLLTAF